MGDKWKNLSSGPQAQKAGGYLKKAETGLWKALDPVGRASNKLANRAGAESFWPTELADGEIEKAARILKTFSIVGAKADDDPRADAKGGVVGDGAEEAAQSSKDKYEARKTQKVIRKIPAKALQGACGVAIFTCFRCVECRAMGMGATLTPPLAPARGWAGQARGAAASYWHGCQTDHGARRLGF